MKPPSRDYVRRFFATGPCLLCGCKTLGAAHRLVDAIRSRHHAAESVTSIARDYALPIDVVRYVVETQFRQLDWLRRSR